MRYIILCVALMCVLSSKGENYDSTYAALDKRAGAIIHMGRVADLKPLSDTMVMLFKRSHNEKYLGMAKAWLGSYYNEIGDFTSSQGYLFSALDIFERLDYQYGICFTEKEIGAFYKYIEHYDEALTHLNLALAILPEAAKDNLAIAGNIDNRIYTHIAECYLRKKYFDSAAISKDTIEYYVQLSNHTMHAGNHYSECRTLFVQALSDFASDPEVAKIMIRKCLDSAGKYDVFIPYIESSFLFARYLFNEKNYTEAKNYALICYNKALETDKKQYIIKASSLLYHIYASLPETPVTKDSATHYLTKKEVYTDTVINYYRSEQVEIRTTELKLRKAKETEDKLKEKKEMRTIIIWTLVIGLICCVIFWQVYKFRKTYTIDAEKRMNRIIFFTIFVLFEMVIILTHSILEYKSFNPFLVGSCVVLTAILFEQLNHHIKKLFENYAKDQHKNKLEELLIQKEKLDSQITGLQHSLDEGQPKKS